MEFLELEFLAGDYFYQSLSPEKWYLLKYFKSDIQLHFLKYFSRFRSIRYFVNHTGYYCSERYVNKMQARYKLLESEMETAKKNFDFAKITLIESGKYKFRRKK